MLELKYMFGFEKGKFLLVFLNNFELRLSSYEISGAAIERKSYDILALKSPIVKDSAILDSQSFQSEIAAFFTLNPGLGKLPVLLIIPEEKVFLKGFELNLGDLEKKESLRKEFINEIPLNETDLIFHERLVGRVIEFSAIHKQFIDDFKAPFLNQKMRILGAVTVPQILALDLHPKDKSLLLAFYDNDFVLALAENSSIIFSETRQLRDGNIKEAMRVFDHFVLHLRATDIKSISIIIGEEKIEDALKLELEQREYVIKEIKKIGILDVIAGYYNSHKNESAEWNLIRIEESSVVKFWNKYQERIYIGFLTAFILFSIGGVSWWSYGQLHPISGGSNAPSMELPKESENIIADQGSESAPIIIEEKSAIVPILALKSDFPIRVFNGTRVAGEAGRLKNILIGRDFIVSDIGNDANQNQVLTTILADPGTPDDIISELRLILESRYAKVSTSSPITADKVIHIIIGSQK